MNESQLKKNKKKKYILYTQTAIECFLIFPLGLLTLTYWLIDSLPFITNVIPNYTASTFGSIFILTASSIWMFHYIIGNTTIKSNLKAQSSVFALHIAIDAGIILLLINLQSIAQYLSQLIDLLTT